MQTKTKVVSVAILVVVSFVFVTKFNTEAVIVNSDEPYLVVGGSKPDLINNKFSAKTESILGFESKYGNLPSTQRGVKLEFNPQLDSDGNLIVTDNIQYIFDFFLSAISEESIASIKNRVDEYLVFYLQEPALGQARIIFEQYINLKTDLVGLEQDMSDKMSLLSKEDLKDGQYLALLREQLDRRSALRAKNLSQEAYDAFYRDEESYDEYTYSRLLITSDKTLSAEEKQQQVSMLQDMLPEKMKASMVKDRDLELLLVKTKEMKEEGVDKESIRQLRQEMYGEEAAERFEALDRKREIWQAKVDTYLQKRNQLMASGGLTQEELQLQVDSLRTSLFDDSEQLRVKMLEQNMASN